KKHKTIKKDWITPFLITKIQNKDKLFAKFLKVRTRESWEEFRVARNELNKLKTSAKNSFLARKYNITNSKKLWSYLNADVFGRKKSQVEEALKINDMKIEGLQLAEKFNNFFINEAVPN